MREYYYLTGLEDSPYNLTMADALHLGGLAELKGYVYLAEPTVLTHLTTDDFAATELEPVAHDGETLKPVLFYEKRWANSVFLMIPPEILTSLERTTKQRPMTYATIDERCNIGGRTGTPFIDSEDWPEKPIRVGIDFPSPMEIAAADVIFWADDLEELANKGRITRRAGYSSTEANSQPAGELEALPHKFQQLYAAIAGGELPDLEAAINAWYLHWHERPARGERDTYPKNPNIQAWLEDRGVSRNKAESIPPLIRPKWG